MGLPMNLILTVDTGLDFLSGFICPNTEARSPVLAGARARSTVSSTAPPPALLPRLLPPPLLRTLFLRLRLGPPPPASMLSSLSSSLATSVIQQTKDPKVVKGIN